MTFIYKPKLSMCMNMNFVFYQCHLNYSVSVIHFNNTTNDLNSANISVTCKGIWKWNLFCTYLRSTLISFSKESSFPFNAFLSMIFMAYITLGSSLDWASRTCEKAPLLE